MSEHREAILEADIAVQAQVIDRLQAWLQSEIRRSDALEAERDAARTLARQLRLGALDLVAKAQAGEPVHSRDCLFIPNVLPWESERP